MALNLFIAAAIYYFYFFYIVCNLPKEHQGFRGGSAVDLDADGRRHRERGACMDPARLRGRRHPRPAAAVDPVRRPVLRLPGRRGQGAWRGAAIDGAAGE